MATHPFDWATWGRIDATELAAKLRAKDVTIPEVMHQFADAISIQNPRLNAVIEVFDDVLDDPDSSGANPDGPFYGVPILIKDMGSRIKGRDQQIGLGFKAPDLAKEDDPLIQGIRISWLIFSLACNHRLHFPNGKTGWRGLEQMRKDCGTREFIAHPSVYLERSLSANLSDVPLTADNTRMEFST